MIYTNIWLTLVTVFMIPLMMKAGGYVAGKSQKYFSAQQTSLGASTVISRRRSAARRS